MKNTGRLIFLLSYAKRIHLHDVMKEINMIEGVINVDYLD